MIYFKLYIVLIVSIVVGAPKANSTYTNHRQIAEPGVVYQCNIDEFIEITPICYPLLLDPTGILEFCPHTIICGYNISMYFY